MKAFTRWLNPARRRAQIWGARGLSLLTTLATLLGLAGLPLQPAFAIPGSQPTQLRIRVVNAQDASVVTNYRFLLNEDNTGDPAQARTPNCDPTTNATLAGCNWPSIRAVASSAPIVTQGDQTLLSATTGLDLQPYLTANPNNPNPGSATRKFLISVVADGYKIGGLHFTLAQLATDTPLTVELEPNPLPTATLRIQVFNDNASVNGQMDAPVELGLNGFEGHIADVLGEVSTDWFGNPICTEYVLVAGQPDPDQPIPGTGGKCLSGDTNHDGVINAGDDPADLGLITIPNLGSNRYAATVVPPDGTNWVQTTTLEGGHEWDTWLQEGATGYDTEFLFQNEPFPWTMFGFVQPRNLATLGTGTITGRAMGVAVYVPPAGGLPNQGNGAGSSGVRPDRPINRPYIALNDLNNGDQMIYMVRGNTDGTFTISNVPTGNYAVTVWDGPQDYLLDFFEVTVPVTPNINVPLGDVFLSGWFARFSGYVFIDDGVAIDGVAIANGANNGVRDCRTANQPRTCERGLPQQTLALKSRSNNLVQHGQTSATTDSNGYYEFTAGYPFTYWQVMENYNDRFYTTGITYRADNDFQADGVTPRYRTVLGTGVDVNVLPIIGLSGTMDWGVRPYDAEGRRQNENPAPPRNGGIVGTVTYDVTRNELDPRLAATEDWQPGIPGVTLNLYAANRQPDGTYTRGALLQTTETESWTRPMSTTIQSANGQNLDCVARDVNGNPVQQQALPRAAGSDCVEAPMMGIQFGPNYDTGAGDWNASVDGNYGFGDLEAGTYFVEVVIPNDAYGRPLYQVTREEDINVFNGDDYTPQVPPPACAGALHTVDVAGIAPDGPTATANPAFVAEGGSPYEGQQRPLCDVKLVTVQNGKSIAPNFNLFTPVPLPGRYFTYIVDDLNLSTNPRSTLYGEKAGLANVPVGIYDYRNRLITTVQSDPNGLFDVLMPSSLQINCPTPSGVCPNMFRLVGNDPGQPGRPNLNHNPQYRTISANFEVWPGVTNPADLAPTQIAVSIHGPGAQINAVSQCQLDVATPQLFAVNQPNLAVGGTLVMQGDGFGAQSANSRVTLDGVPLTITGWNNGAITATVPATVPVGPRQLSIRAQNNQSTINALTIHVTGAGYNPTVRMVNPALPASATNFTTIQAALTAVANTAQALVVVYPGLTGLYNPEGRYFENIVVSSPVKLQGVGPGGVRADGSVVRGAVLDGLGWGDNTAADNWRTLVDGIARVGNQATYEGQIIYVIARTANQFGAAYRAAIDGFTIQNGDQLGFPNNVNQIGGGQNGQAPDVQIQGGGIFVNGFARNLQISNNVLKSNGGAYGGAIRLGTPDAGNNENDNIRILNNRVIANGGTNLAGAVGVFEGADGYEIAYNDLCGNFSAEYGGAVSHYGLSPNGRIHHNRIYFNESYDEGAGVMIAGALPANPNALSTGSGPVDVYNNLIQSNLANDDGGGVRVLMANTAAINIYNNLIVNNISTHYGAGIALNDATNVRIVNNTIMRSLSTATAATAQTVTVGPGVQNTFAGPAGVSSVRNSNALQATLPGGVAACNVANPPATCVSNPALFNNILWDNRAGRWNGATASVLGLGLGGLGDITLWDAGVDGFNVNLSPFNSILNIGTGTNADASNRVGAAFDPQVVTPYNTSVAVFPWRTFPGMRDAAIVALDLPASLLGNYHLQATSPAINLGVTNRGTIYAPATDYDDELRPNGTAVDSGADELSSAAFPANATPLDNFNRANGALGANWRGAVGASNSVRIFSNAASLQSSPAASVFWCAGCPTTGLNTNTTASFGARQEAYFTWTTLQAVNFPQSLILKATNLNSNGTQGPNTSLIYVGYNAVARTVVVDTQAPGQGDITRLTLTNVIFNVGDTLGARALQNGVVGVYRNGVLIGAVNVAAPTGAQPGWPAAQATGGGRIGIQAWGTGAPPSGDARVDNFGGGNAP